MGIGDEADALLGGFDTNVETSDPAAGQTAQPHTDPSSPNAPSWWQYFIASPNNPIKPFGGASIGGGGNDPNAPASPWASAVKWGAVAVVAGAAVVGAKMAVDAWRNL
jgi:hypothetical protein